MRSKDKKCVYNKVVVRAPASTSNLGPGFDVVGLALDVMHDNVEVTCLDKKVVTIEVEGVEADTIPIQPEKNSAGRTALEFLRLFDTCGFKIRIVKGILTGCGLGSSGASAAATAVAINHLLNLKLSKKELTEIAMRGEITPHADNVAPSIYGGFVIISSYDPLDILAFPPSDELEFALAIPENIKKTTKQAREILPTKIPLTKYVHNLGAASSLTVGLLFSKPDLIGQGMLGDQIVDPVRISFYPGCLNAKKAAISAGASGAALSGAGPTIIAIVNQKKADPSAVAKAMKEAFEADGIKCSTFISRPTTGAYIVRETVSS